MINNDIQIAHESSMWKDRQRRKIEYQERLKKETEKKVCPLCEAEAENERLRRQLYDLECRISSLPYWIQKRV